MTKVVNQNTFLKLKQELDAQNVTLVAVSKTKPISDIEKLYAWGQRIFGENRAKELQEKALQCPKDIEWHMIGHLQRNKVKYIIEHVSLIQSIDSVSLLEEVNKRAQSIGRKVDVLLQAHIAQEEHKFGFTKEKLFSFFEKDASTFEHVNYKGIMGMATNSTNSSLVASEFATLQSIFMQCKDSYFKEDVDFSILSMGMSGDYKIAISEGSNMVRIGSLLFGSRN